MYIKYMNPIDKINKQIDTLNDYRIMRNTIRFHFKIPLEYFPNNEELQKSINYLTHRRNNLLLKYFKYLR